MALARRSGLILAFLALAPALQMVRDQTQSGWSRLMMMCRFQIASGHKETRPGRHFDIIDIWDDWNAFASFATSIDFNGIGISNNEKIGGILLKSH